MTIERNVPGYRYDKHSTVYILIQANPLIVNDALKLLSRFGPQYEYPPIATATILEDFRAAFRFRQRDKTCEAIARHSRKDAETYREFALWGKRMLPMTLAGMFNVPIPMPAFLGMLEQTAV